MRAALLLSVALLAPLLALPADAAGPVAPTIYGPTNIPAARNWTYSGQLVVEATGTPTPVYGQTIGLWLDGVRVAEGRTDTQGRYLIPVSFPVGTHSLQARVYEGSAAEGDSPVLTVRAYPTWPAGPSYIHGDPGFYFTQGNISWLYPWTDGGYPVTSYRIDRSANGGPFSTVFTGLAHGFVDNNVTPGSTYVYEGYTTTAWGTSNKTSGTYSANDTVALVDIATFHMCEGAACATVADGGSFTANASAQIMVDAVSIGGVVDTWPVGGPGVANRTVFARVIFPTMEKDCEARSGATGAWACTIGTFFATAPSATGCSHVTVVAHARPVDQGRHEDVGGFDLCVP